MGLSFPPGQVARWPLVPENPVARKHRTARDGAFSRLFSPRVFATVGSRLPKGNWWPPPAGRDAASSSAGRNTMNITVTVNGQPYAHDVEPRLLLVHYLRERLGLTG